MRCPGRLEAETASRAPHVQPALDLDRRSRGGTCMPGFRAAVVLAVTIAVGPVASQPSSQDQALFTDGFERGLAGWRIHGDGVSLHDSGDASHGRVMRLSPSGDVLALVRGSESWGPVRLEGE